MLQLFVVVVSILIRILIVGNILSTRTAITSIITIVLLSLIIQFYHDCYFTTLNTFV